MKKDFSIEEAIRFGWETFKNNAGFFIGVTIIFFLISGAFIFLEVLTEEVYPLANIIILIVGNIVNIFIAFGCNTIIPLKLMDNKKPEIIDLFAGFAYFRNFFLATLILYLAIAGGIMLCIIPGIYAATILYFYSFLIYDKDLGPMESLETSAKITEGARWKVLGFFFAIAGLNLLGVLVCGIGLFVTMPVSAMATAYVYRTLLAQTPDEDTPSAKPDADLRSGGSIDP